MDNDLTRDNNSRGQTQLCHYATVKMEDLYMFMGRELEPLDEIPAGNILGVYCSCSQSVGDLTIQIT